LETEGDKFLEAIKNVREDYTLIDARVVAYHVTRDPPAGDNWVNLASRFTLLTQRQHIPIRKIESTEIPELFVQQEFLPIQDLDRVLGIFGGGELSLGGRRILYKRWANSWGSAYSPFFRRFTREQSFRLTGIDAQGFMLSGNDSYMQAVVGYEPRGQLEARLPSLKPPFSNLQDLATDFVGSVPWVDPWSSSAAEILAPVAIRFSQSSVVSTQLRFQLSIHGGHDSTAVEISYILSTGTKALRRGKIVASKLKKIAQKPDVLAGSLELARSAETVLLLASYRGEEADRLQVFRGAVSGMNPRMAAQEVVDPALKAFSQGLAGEGTGEGKKVRGKGFERSVLLLFHFLGFSCVSTFPETTDSADVLAFTGVPGELVLIECTTDAPDMRNMIGKLSTRKRHYDRRTPPLHVIPVVATSLAKEDVSPVDLDRATKERVIVLTAIELMELTRIANRGETTASVLEYFRSIAPSPFG